MWFIKKFSPMHIKTLLLFSILTFSLSAQQKQRLDFNISYPIVVSDIAISGIIAADLKYNKSVTDRQLFMSIGPTYTLFNAFNDLTMHNIGLDIGINKEIAIHPSINIYPFLNAGFTRFTYPANMITTGLQTEVGMNICHTSLRHWLGIHVAYKYYFVGPFMYIPTNESSNFGVLTTGLHFHL
jgi:hypothetical protein